MTKKHPVFAMIFAKIYPLYINKVECKGRTKAELDTVLRWLTGYSQRELEGQIKKQNDLETFLKEAPKMNPARALIKGVVCGIRVEDIEDPLMRDLRYMDKLVDELAKGKAMEKILRARPCSSGVAQAVFASAADLDAKAVRRWLLWAGENVFDSKAFFKQRRESAKAKA
jgi:hypothetical protein